MRLLLSLCALLGSLFLFACTAKAEADLPLSEEDIARYKVIFAAQEKGKWKTADKHIAKLENDVLLGYVLEQRYMHPTAYRSSYRELSRWLSAYADQPNAKPVYRLAKKRQGRNLAPRKPSPRRWRTQEAALFHPQLEADYKNGKHRHDVARIESRIRYLLRKDRPTQAYNYLNDRKQFNALTAAQTDRVRGWIAANYYYNGNIRKAQQVANQALRRSSDSAVLSHWINGLIAWRQENYSRAYKAFSAQASIPYQENDLRAAAAFWAARGALATGKVDDIDRHLALAAGYPLTFYGQLALGQLGLDPDLDWTPPALTTEGLQKLYAQSPKVERAAALAQVGRTQDAEVELKWAQGEVTREDDVTLIALSYAVGLPSAALSIALQAGADAPERSHLQAGLYPDPSYAPNNGFTVDKAVLYGLIRQESKFMPMARSRVGARGLMQLMPRTASYVAGDGHRSGQLYDPGYNMQLGQSYVEQLLTKYNGKRGDLFEMALSYNWGPGNYHRWQAKTGITDQLLMLESVPNPEARHFVETVLTNIWVYRDRFDEPAPSRDRAAAGKRPVYESVY